MVRSEREGEGERREGVSQQANVQAMHAYSAERFRRAGARGTDSLYSFPFKRQTFIVKTEIINTRGHTRLDI